MIWIADVRQAAELEALHARVAADAIDAKLLRSAQQDAMEHQACLRRPFRAVQLTTYGARIGFQEILRRW